MLVIFPHRIRPSNDKDAGQTQRAAVVGPFNRSDAIVRSLHRVHSYDYTIVYLPRNRSSNDNVIAGVRVAKQLMLATRVRHEQ